MAKGAAILGIIGILLGAGGLGFGFIAWNNQINIQQPIDTHVILYQYDQDIFYGNPENTYLPVNNMSIVFNIAKTSSVFVLFTCRAATYASSSNYARIWFYFALNGVRYSDPSAQVGSSYGTSNIDFHSVALQHLFKSLSSGTHNISIIIYSQEDQNYIYKCALSLQIL